MTTNKLTEQLQNAAQSINFNDVIELIDGLYNFQPTEFNNGSQQNAAGENNGSCKIFAFAKLQNFSQQETLYCFGQYFRDVESTPEGNDHQNIRQFMQHGWDGIRFSGEALSTR